MSNTAGSSLTETLVLALTQCQEQFKVIQQHSSRIDRLQQENEQLKRELQGYRDATVEDVQNNADQTQELFQKYAEAQAEIQVLRSKLTSYKAKTRQRLGVPISSPTSTPVTPLPSSPQQTSAKRKGFGVVDPLTSPARLNREGEQDGGEAHYGGTSDITSSPPPRKRARIDKSGKGRTLQEVESNIVQTKPPFTSTPKNDSIERKIAAIAHVAEDGEEDSPAANGKDRFVPAVDEDDPIHHRLDTLLAGSIPSKSRLARPASRSPQSVHSSSVSSARRLPGISNIQHTISGADTPSNTHSGADITGMDLQHGQMAGKSGHRLLPNIRDHSSTTQQSPSTTKATELLRRRPVTELLLSSFKPNPRWLSSHNVSFDDFLNDRQYERMRTLATTLPHLPGETHDHHFPDDELLIDFLGRGSEDRIANLTPVARQNLVIEARTRRVANGFRLSKQTAIFDDHSNDPPGFWSTDMPGTQEAEENKMASRQKEREEVKRRYDDAMSGQGRWIFADE